MADKFLYRRGPDDARRNNELDLYRESNKQNRLCAEAIDAAIREHWNGSGLDPGAADGIIAEYGHDRVRWVLAAAMKKSDWDKRFTGENREWVKGTFIPSSVDTARFIPSAHPVKLNGFADQARRAYEQLNLFGRDHCIPFSVFQDVKGHVLVLDPAVLADEYKSPDCQVFKAEHGFGCNMEASGRKIFGRHLIDGDQAQYYRQDFLGVLKPEFLPAWAIEKMAGPEQAQAPEPEPVQEPERIRVFQINRDRDTERRCFEPLEPGQRVDASIYDVVYDGPVPDADPEMIFQQFNVNPPPLHRGWSLSPSDVIEVDGKYLYVDRIGFQEIDFDASQTQKLDGLLRVVVLEPGLPAYEGEIGPDLKSMQRAVGGLIEVSYPFDDNAVILGNDEAKLINMEVALQRGPGRNVPPAHFVTHRHIAGQVYAGPLYIIGDDGEGGFCSLTEEQAESYCQEFAVPEEITMEEVQADTGFVAYGFNFG